MHVPMVVLAVKPGKKSGKAHSQKNKTSSSAQVSRTRGRNAHALRGLERRVQINIYLS